MKSHADSQSFHSGHLEQLAVAYPNLQRLNVEGSVCLQSLRGLQAIASHCPNLQGLNLLGIHVSKVEDHILFWEICGDMKLTHLAVEYCLFKSGAANKKKLICLYQKCWTKRGIQCSWYCSCWNFTIEDMLLLSNFLSLKYCNLSVFLELPTVVQDAINSCKELECVRFNCYFLNPVLDKLAHNCNLQQLYIGSPNTDVPDNFMTSVSAHGGLVHVVMRVASVTVEGITSLVRNSPRLITLYAIRTCDVDRKVLGYDDVEHFNDTIKKIFCHRKLFIDSAGHYTAHSLSQEVFTQEGTDLLPLWN